MAGIELLPVAEGFPALGGIQARITVLHIKTRFRLHVFSVDV